MRRIYNRQNSAVQKVQTFDTLATMAPEADGTATIQFRIPVPDSRLRVKVSLLFQPPAGQTFTDITKLVATIWLREADIDASGVAGDLIPLANIEGSEAVPTTIPKFAGLQGYSREFTTAGDYIVGTLTITGNGDGDFPGGSWVLQCRYQPQAVRFEDDEWQQIAANCGPETDSQVRVAA